MPSLGATRRSNKSTHWVPLLFISKSLKHPPPPVRAIILTARDELWPFPREEQEGPGCGGRGGEAPTRPLAYVVNNVSRWFERGSCHFNDILSSANASQWKKAFAGKGGKMEQGRLSESDQCHSLDTEHLVFIKS